MNVQVISSVNEARAEDLNQKTVIVIDVLRATSTMLTALANGCREITPVETVIQAKQQQETGALLGGERNCKKIPGFDFGNSPLEYTGPHVDGKSLVITTTNGTRAIQKAGKAHRILIGSMLNARACAEAAAASGEAVILCSGTNDAFALEDGLCAGLIAQELIDCMPSGKQVTLNDFGLSMLYAYGSVRDRLTETLLSCSNGKRLTRLGFREDVLHCAQVNILHFAPVVQDGKMAASPAYF
ncbi:2-phosphosulfolactate phosphatase [Paenibacillus allorhizosphaerae]|uniref:Probable 2-phosphosulfolactate phosphatase n=1 Tax=Paenibacillus allorhizosphaerae TaxID=2849866 RepID=A0ABN7TK35_9BACL|nr:2-phosphosulfolactate phosphatase [Paenibacillus allorhizosphaerae]CAG7642316.1 putative 2-phosphosulfolactate phosphatase [Paenibacillus allorhizosphaerae]